MTAEPKPTDSAPAGRDDPVRDPLPAVPGASGSIERQLSWLRASADALIDQATTLRTQIDGLEAILARERDGPLATSATAISSPQADPPPDPEPDAQQAPAHLAHRLLRRRRGQIAPAGEALDAAAARVEAARMMALEMALGGRSRDDAAVALGEMIGQERSSAILADIYPDG